MFTKKALDRVRDSRFPAIFNRKLRILAEMLPYVIEHQGESIQAGCDAYKIEKNPTGDDLTHWNDNTKNLVYIYNPLSAEDLQFLVQFVARIEERIGKTRRLTRLYSGTIVDEEFEKLGKEKGVGLDRRHHHPHEISLYIIQILWDHADTDARLV
jgi:hypothetical protein